MESLSARTAAAGFVAIVMPIRSSSFAASPRGTRSFERRTDGTHLDDLVNRQRKPVVKATFVAAGAARRPARENAAQDFEPAAIAPKDESLARFVERRDAPKLVINRAQAAVAQLALEPRPVTGLAKLRVAPGVNYLVQERLGQRIGMLPEMLGRELDDHRMAAVGGTPGRIRKALVVANTAVGSLAVEVLVVQTRKEQLQIGFARQRIGRHARFGS